jgi:hypothetical protein
MVDISTWTPDPASPPAPPVDFGGGLVWTPDIETPDPLGDTKTDAPNWAERVGQDFDKRIKNYEESYKKWQIGEIGETHAELQQLGDVTGFFGDVIGETMISAAHGLGYITPDFIEDPIVDTFKSGWDFLVNTEAGETASEAASKGYEYYQAFKKENPNAAKDFESIVNIAILFAPVKVKRKAEPTPYYKGHLDNIYTDSAKIRQSVNKNIGKLTVQGDALIAKGAKQEVNRSTKKIQQLLFPDKPTGDMVRRTEQVGWMRRNVVTTSEAEKLMLKNVQKVEGLNLNRSPQWNFIKIRNANYKLGDDLIKKLEGSNIIIHPESVLKKIQANVDEMIKNKPFLASDDAIKGQISINMETAAKIINKHPPTPAGLLAARKEFDQVIKQQYGKAFDSAAVTSKSESLKVVRDTINKMIDDSVPDKQVKKILGEQHSLYKAMAMLEDKAMKDGAHRFGRLWQNLGRVIDLKMQSNRTMAIIAGSSAFAAAGTAYSSVAGGIAIYGIAHIVARGVISPKTKMALGQILKMTDKAIKTSTNKNMIKQLRMDRVFVQDLFELPVQKDETTMEK